VPNDGTDVADWSRFPVDERHGGMEGGGGLEEARMVVLDAEAVEVIDSLWEDYDSWRLDEGAECTCSEGDEVMRVVEAACIAD
jgi:hypothetical protein